MDSQTVQFDSRRLQEFQKQELSNLARQTGVELKRVEFDAENILSKETIDELTKKFSMLGPRSQELLGGALEKFQKYLNMPAVFDAGVFKNHDERRAWRDKKMTELAMEKLGLSQEAAKELVNRALRENRIRNGNFAVVVDSMEHMVMALSKNYLATQTELSEDQEKVLSSLKPTVIELARQAKELRQELTSLKEETSNDEAQTPEVQKADAEKRLALANKFQESILQVMQALRDVEL